MRFKCKNCKKKYDYVIFSEEFCSNQCRKIFNRNNATEEFMETINVGKRFLNATLENFVGRASEFKKHIARDMENVVISGSDTGVGKTHLAIGILRNYLLKFPVSGAFVNAIDIIAEVKNSFNSTGPNESEIIKSYSNYKIIVIDDFGNEKQSEFSNSVFYSILNKRYVNMKPTIFTTNLTSEELNSIYPRPIISRMFSGRRIGLRGNDKRILKK